MERFIPMFDDSDIREYELLRRDPEWQAIYELLRKDYWHVTSVDGWSRIRESQSLTPNFNGQYKKRFESITNRSFGYIKGYVSLFDFVTPSDEEVMRQWGKTWDVLVDHSCDQILLQLDRQKLAEQIVPNSACWNKDTGQVGGGCIPYVEVWYPEAISIICVNCVYIIPATSRFEFKPKLFGKVNQSALNESHG